MRTSCLPAAMAPVAERYGRIPVQLLGFLVDTGGISREVYCPFDKHDGIVVGKARVLVLKFFENAKKRGAVRSHAEIVGYGSSSDFNYDPGHPDDFTGSAWSIRRL